MTYKVLFIDHTARCSGAEFALVDLLENLDTRVFSSRVIFFEPGPLADRLCEHGVSVVIVPLDQRVLTVPLGGGLRSTLRAGAGLLAIPCVAGHIARSIRSAQIDVVVTWSNKSAIVGGLAARWSCRPHLHYLHEIISPDTHPPAIRSILVSSLNLSCQHVICNSQATQRAFVRQGGRVNGD